jgi:hypothetical protein
MPQYKIFQIQRSHLGPLPGETRITGGSKSISQVLKDALGFSFGANAFGVESPSFAWFEKGSFITFIWREDDQDFNSETELKTTGEAAAALAAIEARITRPTFELDSELRRRGLRPVSSGRYIPHGGMEGIVYNDASGEQSPVFAAPHMPKLLGKLGDAEFDELIDTWFGQIKDILEKLKEHFVGISVVFHGGGNIPIPGWFNDWCEKNGINVEVEGSDKIRKPVIYLAQNMENDGALSLKEHCGSNWNLGWICRAHTWLNLRLPNRRGLTRYLIGEISLREGDFTGMPGYFSKEANVLACNCNNGSGYQGGVPFKSEAEAVRYLKQYFNVIACGDNFARNGNGLSDQSWIDKL